MPDSLPARIFRCRHCAAPMTAHNPIYGWLCGDCVEKRAELVHDILTDEEKRVLSNLHIDHTRRLIRRKRAAIDADATEMVMTARQAAGLAVKESAAALHSAKRARKKSAEAAHLAALSAAAAERAEVAMTAAVKGMATASQILYVPLKRMSRKQAPSHE